MLLGCEQVAPPPQPPPVDLPPPVDPPDPPPDEPPVEPPTDPPDEPDPPNDPPPPEPEPEPEPPAPPEPETIHGLFDSSPTHLFPDIIVPSDPTALASIVYRGEQEWMALWSDGVRRPTGEWFNVYEATYIDGIMVELWIRTDFPRASAATAAEYGDLIGRTPTLLRMDFERFFLRPEGSISAGGMSGPYFHYRVRWAEDGYNRNGFEEIMLHEETHIQRELNTINDSPAWSAAQQADTEFISDYAESRPDGEDIAETMVAYVGVRYRRGRIGEVNALAIEAALAHRFAILDAQDWDGLWCPIVEADCP